MSSLATQRAAALYRCPSLDDPGCEQHRRDLLAYAGWVGHIAHSMRQEEHSEAIMASSTVLEQARAGRLDAMLVRRLWHWGRSRLDLLDNLRMLHVHGG